jgi:ABC-2 type transport system ATP-binding protein
MTTVVQIEDLSKHFVIRKEKSLKERVVNFGRSRKHREDFWALQDINLEIESGTTVGLIGPNGSGKSTLLKMVGGILQPDTGSVKIRGRLAALLELGAGFHPDLTGRENVYLNASILGLSRSQIDKYFDAIVDFSGIEAFIDTQVKFYSSGMYVRLAFAVAVHVDPDILLVDEVLAVGDEPFQRKCLERIRQFQSEGRTIVLVTHSLEQVADFCDRAVVLEHGRIITDGTPREALKSLRQEFEDARQDEEERKNRSDILEGSRPQARFLGVSVLAGDGLVPNPEISTGDPMSILLTTDVDAGTEIAGAVVTVGIATPLGSVLWSSSSEAMGAEIPILQGTQQFEVSLGPVPLSAGEYSIQASLQAADGTELHRLPLAAQFSVAESGEDRGPVAIAGSFLVRS